MAIVCVHGRPRPHLYMGRHRLTKREVTSLMPVIGLFPGRGTMVYQAGVDEQMKRHSQLIEVNRQDMDGMADAIVRQATLSATMSREFNMTDLEKQFLQLADQSRSNYIRGSRHYHSIRTLFEQETSGGRSRRDDSSIIPDLTGSVSLPRLIALFGGGGVVTAALASLAVKVLICWRKQRQKKRLVKKQAKLQQSGSNTHVHVYASGDTPVSSRSRSRDDIASSARCHTAHPTVV